MEITASLVNELRKQTNLPMMQCKKALRETNGDTTKAIEYLRILGMSDVEKRKDNELKEGFIFFHEEDIDTVGVFRCETESTAKNEEVRWFFEDGSMFDPPSVIEPKFAEMSAKYKEKMTLDIHDITSENCWVYVYVHHNEKICSMLSVNVENTNTLDETQRSKLNTIMKNICLQIVATKPRFISQETASLEYLSTEADIMAKQLKADPKNNKKPEQVLVKIMEGKINKLISEICLSEQEYIMDPKMTVREYINKEWGQDFDIVEFKLLEV